MVGAMGVAAAMLGMEGEAPPQSKERDSWRVKTMLPKKKYKNRKRRLQLASASRRANRK